VPVVLNLSSWKKKLPLAEWISGELLEKYRVPRKIAQSWLQNNYLLPLLDGLDEVQTPFQPDCVGAINAFIGEFDPPGLVVCCRLNEYRWLPERLKLNGAICLESLSSEEVSSYLDSGGPNLAGLREAVNTDPALQELTQTPLMLTIMSLTCQGVAINELARQTGDSLEKRRKQVFCLYVDQMFQRKGTTSLEFPKEKTIGWLSWLASKMRGHSRSIFLVEELQPSWLGAPPKSTAYLAVTGLIHALLYGLIYGLTCALCGPLGWVPLLKNSWAILWLMRWPLLGALNSWLNNDVLGWLVVGLILGLSSGIIIELIGPMSFMDDITLVERMSWDWAGFLSCTVLVLIVTPIVWLFGWLRTGTSNGLFYALLAGLIYCMLAAFKKAVRADKPYPNPGIKLSLENALVVFLLAAVIGGLSVGALAMGVSSAIKHYVLRFTLCHTGCIPPNFIKFLDHCARLILLKKVGGGYIFIHRMLIDYFADLPAREKSGESKGG
jgi:hypothetical protein